MATQSTYWGTLAELEHIDGLGTFNIGSEKTPRRQWLADYIAAMRLRVEWGAIDREKVLDYARQELEAILKAENPNLMVVNV